MTFNINSNNQTQLLATVPAVNNGIGKATAPPGYYMLFIVNSSNVPSVSWIDITDPTNKKFLVLQ